MREINKLYIHQSASNYGSVEWIRQVHVEENSWSDIGYHVVILNGKHFYGGEYIETHDGMITMGRPFNIAGAHVKGDNETSIGICLIGTSWNSFTHKQMNSLIKICAKLIEQYNIPISNVLGHFETTNIRTSKTCPFSKDEADVASDVMNTLRLAIANHLQINQA